MAAELTITSAVVKDTQVSLSVRQPVHHGRPFGGD